MAVFPKKPYKVGGCTIDLTQTTEGRVCPTTTSQRQAPGYVDTFGDVRWQFQSTHILLVPADQSGQVRALLKRDGILLCRVYMREQAKALEAYRARHAHHGYPLRLYRSILIGCRETGNPRYPCPR